jgi:tRNA-splicing ligase RtcB
VRLVSTPLSIGDIDRRRELIETLYQAVPTGVGAKGPLKLSMNDLEDMMVKGAAWPVTQGYGLQADLEHCEEHGCMAQAEIQSVSAKAKQRGMPQNGTLGAGNHFLEIQVVKEIYDPDAAKAYGIHPGMICIMIHCGSRGLGHQTCTDHIKVLEGSTKRYDIILPDRQLACAPLSSPEGKAYFGAMAASANYAWANRQMIMHTTRTVFEKMYGIDYESMHLIYDVAHNIAKMEEHSNDGKRISVCVHRKGATRAFGPGSPDLPPGYSKIGQPVIIPGSMGSSSYLLRGTVTAMERTFGSTCHGAGRILSRSAAKKTINGAKVKNLLSREGIIVRAPNDSAIAEEAPGAYKPSAEVVRIVDALGISNLVARLEPLGVIKG